MRLTSPIANPFVAAVGGFAALLVTVVPLPAADLGHELDFETFMEEVVHQTSNPDRVTMAWWLPEEFWEYCFSADGDMSDDEIDEFLKVLRPYVMVAVVDGTIGPLGGVTFVSPRDLRKTVVLVDTEENRYEPIERGDIDPDAANLVAIMGPMIAAMMGPAGENMAFLYFPFASDDGKLLADASKPGAFGIEIGEESFEWETPLSSLLPPRYCAEDGRQMSGAWIYCPWHGSRLSEDPEEIAGAAGD